MTHYISLAEYFWLAEQVTGIDAAVLTKASRVDLADSGLNAPSAGYGDDDFYPDLIDKAAVPSEPAISGVCGVPLPGGPRTRTDRR